MQSVDPAWSRSIRSVSGIAAAQLMLPILQPEDVARYVWDGKELQSLCSAGHGWLFDGTGGEVAAVRVVEHQRTHAGLGLHHHSFGQLNSDFLWLQ